jgi:hypothetical protein
MWPDGCRIQPPTPSWIWFGHIGFPSLARFEVALFGNAVAFLTTQNMQLKGLNRTLTRVG